MLISGEMVFQIALAALATTKNDSVFIMKLLKFSLHSYNIAIHDDR